MSYNETVERLKQYTDYPEFECLCTDILSSLGYEDIDPQGIEGKDGGKDALIRTIDGRTICHYSTREDWATKLAEDLDETVNADKPCTTVIFCTNRPVGGTAKDERKDRIHDEYGWELELYDAERLRTLLDTRYQDLHEQHLGIAKDPASAIDVRAEIEAFRDRCIQKITLVDRCWFQTMNRL